MAKKMKEAWDWEKKEYSSRPIKTICSKSKKMVKNFKEVLARANANEPDRIARNIIARPFNSYERKLFGVID